MYEILYQNGLITITTFNTFLTLAFILSAIFLVRFIHLKKIKLSFFVNNFGYLMFTPFIGGRIFYIFEHLSFFIDNPFQSIAIWDFKFSAFGIFYGAVLTLFLLCRREREDFWSWFDALALSGLVGLVFIHIGTFFAGTNYGIPTDLPWGITFDTFNIPFIKPIHPVQIYSSIVTFIIFSIGIHSAKRTHLTGIAGNLSVMMYSIAAFGIDFLHGAPSTYTKINFLIIAAAAFIFYMNCSHKKLFSQS